MDIKCRDSIHCHNLETQIDANTSAALHSSQEHLSDSACSETDDSLLFISTNSKDSTIKNNSPQSSTSVRNLKRRNNPKVIRSESPTRLQPKLTDLKNRSEIVSSSKSSCTSYKSAVVLCICLVIYFIYLQMAKIRSSTTVISANLCSYSDLKTKYINESEHLWKNMKYGVENIINDLSDKPSVFLFVHNGKDITKDLIKDIANTMSACIDSSQRPIVIENFDLISEGDSGVSRFIQIYKERTREGNVILIPDLNEIPSEVIMGLHAICDVYRPIVQKVIILLSLVAEHKKERIIDTAMDALRQLWKQKVDAYEIDALLTRVTDEVILLQSI